jgi:methanogen homoaconitase large subunit
MSSPVETGNSMSAVQTTPRCGQTLSEQIFSHKAGTRVVAGQLVVVRPEVAMGHDSLTPSIIKIMREELGVRDVADPDQIVLVMDHVAPSSTVGTANAQATIRQFAAEQGIRLFDVGRGICHQVLVEEKIASPGRVIIGSDSHSTSYGAVSAFGTGMGSTDIALCWATGKAWFRIPESIRIDCRGRFPHGVDAKDLALWLCRKLTLDGATYEAIEYHGLDWLPLPQRQTVASMAIELGAKAGMFAPGRERRQDLSVPPWLKVDSDANFKADIRVDLDQLEPQIAVPHSVDSVVDLGDVRGQEIDVVFLGTCTNGRAEDLACAAEIVAGYTLKSRMIVTPASSRVLQKAIEDGSLGKLIAAGATITTPGCGPCMGRHQGTLADNERCLSTGNRNFRGRMGSPEAQIYLASPAVAAATAISGRITDPRELPRKQLLEQPEPTAF